MTEYTDSDWSEAAQKSVDVYEKLVNSEETFEATKTDLTKYFTIMLPENENKGEKTVRLLPFEPNSRELFKLVKFHNLKVGNKWRKLYDPEQDGEVSPLNDMYRILNRGDKEDKKLSYTYKSRDFYIIRCIERGREEEGVKFWRFPARDGEGVMDKLNPLIEKQNQRKPGSGAIWRPDGSGRDIIISIVRDKGKGKNYTKVSSIQLDDPSPLSNDPKQAEMWLNDTLSYRDVFRKKPTEFLELVAQGVEPYWDMATQKFVPKHNEDEGGEVYTHNDVALPIPSAERFDEDENQTLDAEESNETIPVQVDDIDLPF